MAISSYTDLQAKLASWLKGTDLSGETDTLIGLVESNLNRQLRVPQMEALATITSTTDSFDLPGDFLQLKTLRSGSRAPLKYVDQNDFQQYYSGAQANPAVVYTIVSQTVYVAPNTTESVDYSLTYWQQIPSLTEDMPTNWLMAANSDIYFFGALSFAEAFGWNDERVPLFRAAFDEAVDALKVAGIKARYGAGPLVPQPPVTDMIRGGDPYRRAGYVDDALLGDGGEFLIDG